MESSNTVTTREDDLLHAFLPLVNPLTIVGEEADEECGCFLRDVVGTLAKPMIGATQWIFRDINKVIKNDFHDLVGGPFAPDGFLAEAFEESFDLRGDIGVCREHARRDTIRIGRPRWERVGYGVMRVQYVPNFTMVHKDETRGRDKGNRDHTRLG